MKFFVFGLLLTFNAFSSTDLGPSRLQLLSGQKLLKLPQSNLSKNTISAIPQDLISQNSNIFVFKDLVKASYFAHKGHRVTLLNQSNSVIEKVKNLKQEFGIEIKMIENLKLMKPSYDVVVVSQKVAQKTLDTLTEGLKTGGLIYYESLTTKELENNSNIKKEYLVTSQELLETLKTFKVLKYEELPNSRPSLAKFIGIK